MGCGSHGSTPPPPAPTLTPDQLMDPAECQGCHQDHYREWSGSMHAYASDDPIFRAMNKRAQRETGGAIGNLCVNCHAPVAVMQNATTDGSNLDSVPEVLHGVTCFFCHTVDAVNGTHNNPLHHATDGVLRAALDSPLKTGAHPSAYSTLHDGNRVEAAGLCGTCHDVQTPTGVDIEQTYAEWQGSLFSQPGSAQLTCTAGCHMPNLMGLAANVPNAPARTVHDHSMPGVDLALTPGFAEADVQKYLVQQNLDPDLVTKLCVMPAGAGPNVTVSLDDAFVGHNWPSGAVHDRRAWVELIAYQGTNVVFQTGVVQGGEDITKSTDPTLWLLREKLTDATGAEVSMLWKAAKATPDSLPPAVTNDQKNPAYYHAVVKSFTVPPAADHITLRVRIIPIGYDVIDDLTMSGDIDPMYRALMTVFDLAGGTLDWKTAQGFNCVQ
jgi:hypothetical protein